jgi:hypothetical protein
MSWPAGERVRWSTDWEQILGVDRARILGGRECRGGASAGRSAAAEAGRQRQNSPRAIFESPWGCLTQTLAVIAS